MRGLPVLVLVAAVGWCAVARGADRSAAGHTPAPARLLRRVFVDKDQRERRYLLFLPFDFAHSDRRPLLMFLNGLGENGEDGVRQISNNFGWDFWRLRDALPFVIVIPQCHTNGSWADLDGEGRFAIELLDEIEREFGTDPDRVYLTGVSSGATGVWSIASAHPERFAAIAPMCAGGGPNAGMLADANLPIWNFFNDGDKAGLVEFNRQIQRELLARGMSPRSTEYHQQGHTTWIRAYATEALNAWYLSHDRETNRRDRATFTMVAPSGILADWERAGSADWQEKGELLRCAALADSEPGWLISPFALGAGELHLEAKWPRQAVFRLGLFDPADASRPAVTVEVPFAEFGWGGLAYPNLRDFEERANARLDPVAQRQLSPAEWNDLRLDWRDGWLRLSINGWQALEWPGLHGPGNEFRFGMQAAQPAEQGWQCRYVRWRGLEEASAAAAQNLPRSTRDSPITAHQPIPSPNRDDEQVKKELEAVWREREEAFATAEVRWKERRNGFRMFGGYPFAPQPLDESDGATERFLMDGSRWRQDGWRTPQIALGEGNPLFRQSDGQIRFLAMLQAGDFSTDAATAGPVSYTRWNMAAQRIELWRGSGEQYPRALIERAPAEQSDDVESSPAPSRHIEDVLLTGLLLALRPYSQGPLAKASESCKILNGTGSTGNSTPEWVLVERRGASRQGKTGRIRHYWIDARCHAIVRVIEFCDDVAEAQIDFEYEHSGESNPLPVRWSGIVLDGAGEAGAFAYAERTSASSGLAELEKQFQVEFPPDSWVVNRATSESYLARRDGSRLLLTGQNRYLGVSYKDLVAGRDSVSGQVFSPTRGKALRRILMAWLTWPGIGLTVACLVAVRWYRRRVSRRRASVSSQLPELACNDRVL